MRGLMTHQAHYFEDGCFGGQSCLDIESNFRKLEKERDDLRTELDKVTEKKNSQGIKKGDVIWVLRETKWVKAEVMFLKNEGPMKDNLVVKVLSNQECSSVIYEVEPHQYQLPEIWHT